MNQEELIKQLGIDRVEVVNFVDHLKQAFEKYVNKRAEQGKEVTYSEALMAVHNFHKLIILDIEERHPMQNEGLKREYRQLWVDTLSISLLGTEEQKQAIRAKNHA